MGYSFQVVPIEDFKRLSSELSRLAAPLERYQALRVGACCILLAETSNQCLANIPEEKRRLAIWVRNQRSVVRHIRYKGASKTRGALNADISNASDAAKGQLEWIRNAAEHALQQSGKRTKEYLQYVSEEEAKGYTETFRNELNTRASAENAKKILIGLLIGGAIGAFIIPPAGIALLIAALFVYLSNKERWKRLDKAESERTMQMNELRGSLTDLKEFDAELEQTAESEPDTNQVASLRAISLDLESRYTYLDVACRDLGSTALTWRELAQELYSQSSEPLNMGEGYPSESKKPESARPANPAGQLTQKRENPTDGRNPTRKESSMREIVTNELISKDIDDYCFTIGIELARQIMQALGYKRMPSEWATISIKAEERISRYLAERAGIKYDDFFWSFEEGNVRAEAL
jgi:hypothetical protein